ncbi:CLIP domain-containing serine protease, partial [Coemansia nantahalensis]
SKTQLCTDGTAGKDTCQGDSGGPLITPAGTGKPPALLALTSYGTTNSLNPLGLCGARGSSGYYTYIAPFLNWVAKSANLDVDAIRVGGSGSGDDDDSKPTNDDDDSKPTNDDDDSPTTRSTKSRSRTSRTTSPTSASRKPTDDDDDDDVPPPFWRASGASRSHFGLAAAGVAVAAMLF